jgi:integrase/recombinase XerD
LGHVNLETTNRYAEITVRMKANALELCEPVAPSSGHPRKSTWQEDADLMSWLSSL